MKGDSLYAAIGARMRALREAQKRTQAEVAEAAGIESSFYGQLERGANVPSLKTLIAVSAALGVGPAELLPETPPADAYAKTIERLMDGLADDDRKTIVGIVRDITARFGGRRRGPRRGKPQR